MHRIRILAFVSMCMIAVVPAVASVRAPIWDNGGVTAHLVLPDADEPTARLARATLARYLRAFYAVELPVVKNDAAPGTYIVVGTPENNSVLARLIREGLKLPPEDPGDEGFRLVTYEVGTSKYVVIHGRTPRAVKHGCQELVFYAMPASAAGGAVEWPLKIAKKPEVAYRGIYMLPCWSAHDSIESWHRVLRFTSELTLNRAWFWLDGFPVAGHRATSHISGQPSDYGRTDLAKDANVQSLIDLVNDEDMKFHIGGGWMSWHQQQAVGKDRVKSKEFYLDYLRAFRNVGGFYFEPTGEGSEDTDWRPIGEALRDFIQDLLRENPKFEIALAIGQFNNPEYLKMMAQLDPRRVFWWWCWGDPARDKALSLYQNVLGWHTVVRMSNFHGTVNPPSASDLALAGMSTSYDPGMGFGNKWNGWGKMGVGKPRNFDPYTMPYFSHEYRFRERCWNPRMTDEAFSQRLGKRLFDEDMPKAAIGLYLKLADLCFSPAAADAAILSELDAFVQKHKVHGTPRNQDTIKRMAEAVHGLRNPKPQKARKAIRGTSAPN